MPRFSKVWKEVRLLSLPTLSGLVTTDCYDTRRTTAQPLSYTSELTAPKISFGFLFRAVLKTMSPARNFDFLVNFLDFSTFGPRSYLNLAPTIDILGNYAEEVILLRGRANFHRFYVQKLLGVLRKRVAARLCQCGCEDV